MDISTIDRIGFSGGTTMLVKDSEKAWQQISLPYAMTVLNKILASIPRDDRADCIELLRELADSLECGDQERYDAAVSAFVEILEHKPGKVDRLKLEDQPSESLDQWLGFVSKKIKRLRKAAGLTQVELARRTGIGQAYISRLETGKHSPSFFTLKKIAEALSIPVSEIDPSAPESDSLLATRCIHGTERSSPG